MAWVLVIVVVISIAGAAVLSHKITQGSVDNIGWLRRRHYEPWNGMYYEFATIHLRAAELEDGNLVFLENDLLMVIEQTDSTTVKLFGPAERVKLAESGDMALTQAGCERLLIKSPHSEAKKLLLFLQRDCFKPHAKKHGRMPA